MGLRLLVKPVHQITAQDDPHRGKPRKNDDKRHADLPEKLQRQAAVIPHLQMKPFIHDDSGDKLHGSNKYHASDELQPQRILPEKHPSLDCEKYEAESAQDKHAPVGKAPEDQLKSIIDTASYRP